MFFQLFPGFWNVHHVRKTVSLKSRKRWLQLLLVAGTVWAVSGNANAAGRYSMTPTDDGMLRLDTQTGAVTMCRKTSDSWKCEDIAGGRAMVRPPASSGSYRADNYESELERLRRENQQLRARLAARGPVAPREKLELPTEEDVDKVVGFVERMIERFNGIVEKLKKDQPAPGTPL